MSVYEKEKPEFLDEALKSIESQTVVPNQIVLISDGPLTPKLDEIIKQHQLIHGELYDVFKTKHNQGLGAALRFGTSKVRSDWIARMDSDDIAVPNRFELQLKEIMANPNLALLGGQVDEFENSIDNIVGHREVPLNNEKIHAFLKLRNPFNHPTVMINKNVLQSVGGYNSRGNLEDYFLWVKVISSGSIVKNMPDVLVHMRVNEGMYGRRGGIKNLKYILKLQKLLYESGLVSVYEGCIWGVVMIANTFIPGRIRKILYKNTFHR
ncbi:glycosyl transferase family 2 [Paucilactobacillus vaccinostercus DSM 20634]|uniref:Glycosyl transferase family 2 n=2 Tax=Paucilactobacillus vaccinostercus TaxID=176291 RepID=A0A0R2AE67_9LACO|nr:glycosyl transferase family 2 [Paucilactobacillus vaccinostercus DSM 20634]